jgi:uncharacterized protein YuzE
MNRKVAISYDRDADVMYLSFDNVEAEADEVENGVFARYDHKTGKLAGFTIINFSKKFTRKPREITIPVRT